MKFSTKAEYGLRGMVNLARNFDQKYHSLNTIAKEEQISLAYLERLFAKLKKAGLVVSEKGVNGGYRLAREPKAINAGEIVEVLEGTLSPFACVDNDSCKQQGCGAKIVWQKLSLAIRKSLNSITLDQLIG